MGSRNKLILLTWMESPLAEFNMAVVTARVDDRVNIIYNFQTKSDTPIPWLP